MVKPSNVVLLLAGVNAAGVAILSPALQPDMADSARFPPVFSTTSLTTGGSSIYVANTVSGDDHVFDPPIWPLPTKA